MATRNNWENGHFVGTETIPDPPTPVSQSMNKNEFQAYIATLPGTPTLQDAIDNWPDQ